jgi:tRNA modification GTPase
MSSQPSNLTPRSAAELDEPIVALSSAPGSGARAIVRLSGIGVWPLVCGCVRAPETLPPAAARGHWHATIMLPDFMSGIPVQLLVWQGPRSYTGQDLIEIHLISSPPLVDALLAELLRRGARLARPGEFTLRAFLHGKLDLTQAEAVRSVIEAEEPAALTHALQQLAGGVARPLQELRDTLLSLLAEIEAGLDFAEEDLAFIGRTELLATLQRVRNRVIGLLDQLQERGLSGIAYRVVLSGPPNAGKSSLFNALIGRAAALVSPEPGTTRDFVSERVTWDGVPIELIDTAGEMLLSSGEIEAQAQAARQEQARRADLLLVCAAQDSGLGRCEPVANRPLVYIRTKSDHGSDVRKEAGVHYTSAKSGEGVAELRQVIRERLVHKHESSALVSSGARCRPHLEACLDHLTRAEALAAKGEPPELLALELRLALEQVGELAGTVFTEDLLDRIFSQFCIGK